mgnify:CR=1 FL=1
MDLFTTIRFLVWSKELDAHGWNVNEYIFTLIHEHTYDDPIVIYSSLEWMVGVIYTHMVMWCIFKSVN